MKKSIVLSFICASIVLFFGCTHNENSQPKVKTGNVFMHNFNVFSASGIVDANGSTVTRCGICYSTSDKKPDISGPHTDMMSEDAGGTFMQYPHFDVIVGTQPILGSIYLDDNVIPNTLYVRAYAMTADGKFAYGKTVEFNVNDENNWAVLLTKPTSWKKVSSSVQMPQSQEQTLAFRRDGSAFVDNMEDYNDFWIFDVSDDYLNVFLSGSSMDFYPSTDDITLSVRKEIHTSYEWVCMFYYNAIVLDLSTNVLKISRAINDQPAEITYVPVP